MVQTGLMRLMADPSRLRGARVGLVTHAAAVLPDLTSAAAAFAAHPAIELAALFGPQHGLTAHTQDNMIEWSGGTHPRYGIPVHSLYGEVRKPTPEMLAGLDLLVVDFQDVGTRVYTYLWTLALVLEAAGEQGLPVLVLDRPNPLGGAVEGPVLAPGFESFIGLYPLPLRHGLTLGEAALLLHHEHGLGGELEVLEMRGWRRGCWFDETGLPWVMPSPNMPTLETAVVYPGAVLFEGTQLSEGRGTTRPFEILGAPGIDADALAEAMNALALPGVRFRPVFFEPTFQKHAGRGCGGVQIHVIDREAYPAVLTATLLLQTIRTDWPESFGWLPPPYEYVHDREPIDILAGSDDYRQGVEAGREAADWAARWSAECAAFEPVRQRSLRYPC